MPRPFPRDPLWHCTTLLEKINAIPRTLLPEGKARNQLIIEAKDGGPLIDIYTKTAMTDDYTGGEIYGFVIERPLPGRPDTRWPPPEWQVWVDGGMMDFHCDFCWHTPSTFALSEEFRTADGHRIYICYDCRNAVEGRYGFTTPHAVITCPSCGQVGLQLFPDDPRCLLCVNGRR